MITKEKVKKLNESLNAISNDKQALAAFYAALLEIVAERSLQRVSSSSSYYVYVVPSMTTGENYSRMLFEQIGDV